MTLKYFFSYTTSSHYRVISNSVVMVTLAVCKLDFLNTIFFSNIWFNLFFVFEWHIALWRVPNGK